MLRKIESGSSVDRKERISQLSAGRSLGSKYSSSKSRTSIAEQDESADEHDGIGRPR